MAGTADTLKRGLKSHGKTKFLSPMDEVKAMGEIAGKTVKTVGKRLVGDDSGTDLYPNTEAFAAKVTKKKDK